jgi:hypothetical protein
MEGNHGLNGELQKTVNPRIGKVVKLSAAPDRLMVAMCSKEVN